MSESDSDNFGRKKNFKNKKNKIRKDLSDNELSDSEEQKSKKTVTKLKQQLKLANKEISELKEELEEKVDEIKRSKDRQIKKLEKSIKELYEEMDEVKCDKEEFFKLKKSCKDKEKEIKGLKENIEELKMPTSKATVSNAYFEFINNDETEKINRCEEELEKERKNIYDLQREKKVLVNENQRLNLELESLVKDKVLFEEVKEKLQKDIDNKQMAMNTMKKKIQDSKQGVEYSSLNKKLQDESTKKDQNIKKLITEKDNALQKLKEKEDELALKDKEVTRINIELQNMKKLNFNKDKNGIMDKILISNKEDETGDDFPTWWKNYSR